MIEQRRILITGSSGFTGRALMARLLKRGHDVWGLTRTPIGDRELFGDLSSRASTEMVLDEVRPDTVVHLAGVSSPVHADLAEIYESNVVAGVNLLQGLAERADALRLLLIASSATVYRVGSAEIIDEGNELGPKGHYAISKRCLEDIAAQFDHRIPIRIIRPFNYTGPGQSTSFFVPKVVKHFACREPYLEVGNLDVVRDISAIDDVTEAYVRLLEAGGPGVVVNICSGKGVRLSDILDRASELSGHRLEIRDNPTLARKEEASSIIGSRARLDQVIGTWNRITLDQLLKQMLNAWSGCGGEAAGGL